MGCGNPKEKVEDKMMKMKMALIEVQMEKYKQLELLKKMDGKEIETPNIPNYIDKEFLNKYFSTKRNSSSTKDDFLVQRPGRSKSVRIKRRILNKENENKEDIKSIPFENQLDSVNKNIKGENGCQNDEQYCEIKIRKRRYTQKKKTVKMNI